jgi:ATP-binding cassette, subfamily C (CFTR/MRP), member 1
MQVRAAVSLHNQLLERVLRLPVSFFDANPSGRIINRFSRDTEIMNAVLPLSLFQVRVSGCHAPAPAKLRM